MWWSGARTNHDFDFESRDEHESLVNSSLGNKSLDSARLPFQRYTSEITLSLAFLLCLS